MDESEQRRPTASRRTSSRRSEQDADAPAPAKRAKREPDADAKRAPEPKTAQRAPADTAADGILIDSHRKLIGQARAMFAALAADPARTRLLLANPALAFESVGYRFSPEIREHILETMRHSGQAATRRTRLREELRKALGVEPRPADPLWLARTIFTRLNLPPLDTTGLQPPYRPQIPPDALERLNALRPARANRTPLPSAHPREALWRLDIDAAPPTDIPEADEAPPRLSLPHAWFYLGRHELVHPLLELGIIDANVAPVVTRTRFGAVARGTRTGDFVDWVTSIELPPAPRRAKREP